MAKKSAKKQPKKTREEIEKMRDEYYDNIPEKDLNPNAKEDFEKLLKLAFPPVKKKENKK